MAGLLLDHLWQSTLFALAAALAALALGRNPARVRFWVWFAAAAKFLIPFATITWGAAWLAAHLHAQTPAHLDLARQVLTPATAPVPARIVRPLASARPDAWPWLAMAWGVGVLTILSRRAIQGRDLSRALNAGARVALPVALPAITAPMKGGPALMGLFRPKLVMPMGLVERLTPAELEAVLEHEQQHARRRDNLLTLPMLAVQALFWFHPLVWWIGGRLLAERERACDEAVIEDGIDAETYARGLLQVCRFEIEPPPAWAAAMTGANLKLRIRRIMSDRAARPLGPCGRTLLASGLGAILALPVAAGVFIAPTAAGRLLMRLAHPLPILAAPTAQAAAPASRYAHARPVPVRADRPVLLPTPAVLTAGAELTSNAAPVGLNQRVAEPAFEAVRIAASDAQPESVAEVTASAGLLQAIASRTDRVIDAGVWGDRLELRTASSRKACPTAQVERAEAALGGEAISTAFDGQVGHFVEDALAGRPAGRDLAPGMARAVEAVLPGLQPVLARTFASSGPARLLGEDAHGRDVYLVRRSGQDAYVLVVVDDDGRIETALFCATP